MNAVLDNWWGLVSTPRPDRDLLLVFSDFLLDLGLEDEAEAVRWLVEGCRWPCWGESDTYPCWYNLAHYSLCDGDEIPSAFFSDGDCEWGSPIGGDQRSKIKAALRWFVERFHLYKASQRSSR
jgi:hypothetical protein